MPRQPRFTLAFSMLSAATALAAVSGTVQAQTACGHWEPLVQGLTGDLGSVQTRAQGLAVFDAGDGPMLYLAGNFEAVIDPVFGEVRAPGLARWDGERWSAVPGLDGPGLELDRRAITLEVYNDGSGPALYVGGEFTVAAGLEANGIARWDGVAWSVLDGPGKPGEGTQINDIHPHDFGDGDALYFGGEFLIRSPRLFFEGVRRWDGSRWTEPGANLPDGTVTDLASFGGQLFAAGTFNEIGAQRSPGIAVLDGDAWSTPAGPGQEISGEQFRILVPTEIDGREVLVTGGIFSIAEDDEVIARRLAAWDGERWTSLDPTGPDQAALPLDVQRFDDGAGALYVGGLDVGYPSSAGRLVDGVLHPQANMRLGIVFNLFVHDDGTGPGLLAAGVWRDASGFEHFLSRWQPTERCALDLSGDCLIDTFDFVSFQNLFAADDPLADFDGDGSLTVFDFLAFQNAFEAGCP